MSRLPTITLSGGTTRIFSIDARVGEVVGTIGSIPGVLVGAVAERTIDAVDYHKRTIIKNAAKLPGGRDAQRFVATRLFGYGRKRADPQTLGDVQGESFGAAVSGPIHGERVLKTLEEGGRVNASGYMAIPFNRLPARFRSAQGGGWLRKGVQLEVSPRGVISFVGVKSGITGKGVGVFRKVRNARPLLGFFAAWDSIEPRVTAKYEADLERVLTEAGRAGLAERLSIDAEARRAGASAFRSELQASPKDFPGARAAAKAAARAVRADALSAPGDRA